MKRTVALALLAASFGAPLAANAAQTAEPAPSPLVSQLAMSNARFTILDANGNPVAILTTIGNGGLTLRQIGVAKATGDGARQTFRVDYSKALTAQQQDDAYHAAYDQFFGELRSGG